MAKKDRRFHRQFDVLSRHLPALRVPVTALQTDRWRVVRLPVALLLIAGGFVSFLPFLGIWMLPLGLLLLAIDLPFMRGPIAAAMILGRRRLRLWWRWSKARGQR